MDLRPDTFETLAGKLRALGIGGLTPGRVSKIEASYRSLPPEVLFHPAACLLASLGQGEGGYRGIPWTPGKNGVFCFDAELFDLESPYTGFLRGVSALDETELDFRDIQEDTSGVDWEEGTGTRVIRFTWRGDTYTLEATEDGDWFDGSFLDKLGGIIRQKSGGKKLFFCSDGYQATLIFYRDDSWAEEFQREIGLQLERQLP